VQANVEVFHARFNRHRFAPHAHDTWAIGAVLRGTKDTSARAGQAAIVEASQTYAIAPGVAHAGRSVNGQTCEYVMLYVPDAEWRMRCDIHGVAPDAIVEPSTQPRLTAQFAALSARVHATPDAADACEIEWSLFWEGVCAAMQPTDAQTVTRSVAATDRPLERVREYLHVALHRNVSLTELSLEASLSAPELCRRFSAAYGLSPHRYQLVQRLMQCKRLLLDAVPLTEVATVTGFADQSHMGRHFRAMFGMTPGAIARHASSRTF
jgi:AraC-like DNA-binding protein